MRDSLEYALRQISLQFLDQDRSSCIQTPSSFVNFILSKGAVAFGHSGDEIVVRRLIP